MIVPFLALIGALAACDDLIAPARSSRTGRSAAAGGDGLPWAPRIPWAEGSGPIFDYFHAPEGPAGAERRARAVAALVAQRGDRPFRPSEELHGAGLFRPLEARRGKGRAPGHQLIVPVGHDHARRVYVRVPEGYTPERPWPLILAYHPSGGDGRPMIGRIERLLGGEVDRYVVAAPDHYRQTSLDHPRPVSSEHLAVLHALQGMVHVDGDRVYVTGYSLGGYTAWHLGALHADRFAAAVPMAGTFGFLGGPDGVWTEFLANLEHLPVLSVWGGRDRLNVPGLNARGSAGSMSDVNRRLAPLLERHGAATVTHHEVPGAGHGGATPPRSLLLEHLRAERVRAPRDVEHWFRYVHQAHAYWIEGHHWQGELWDRPWPPVDPRRGESRDAATWRAIRERLGMIRGTIRGGPEGDQDGRGGAAQRIEVETRHLADLTVWIEDGMIDWSRPVTVAHNGREAFTGTLKRDPAVALAEARRTRDFDRIRWAGVRIDATTGTGRPVAPEEDLPPVLREVLD
ncbi:MAG: hypothetical protein PVG07_13760 [Acidobacteriota bacterium]